MFGADTLAIVSCKSGIFKEYDIGMAFVEVTLGIVNTATPQKTASCQIFFGKDQR